MERKKREQKREVERKGGKEREKRIFFKCLFTEKSVLKEIYAKYCQYSVVSFVLWDYRWLVLLLYFYVYFY